jgi:hypothetical protein
MASSLLLLATDLWRSGQVTGSSASLVKDEQASGGYRKKERAGPEH